MRSDPRLVNMWWDGGLVMVSAIVEDAAGGTGLPGSPSPIAPGSSPSRHWGLRLTSQRQRMRITKMDLSLVAGGMLG
ncbi:unnamed protein product [Ectocarpus sp. 4 AP-2014]